jgi:murein DD-endopeptidase MepM/ murein hydrolase activator NlpD
MDDATAPDGGGRSEEASAVAGITDDATPSTASTGRYIWPTNGTLGSGFGPRNATIGSSNHKGIDIGGIMGQPIFASDGGEVIFSGWSDSYGYYIRLRHDNGDVTLYAHCNSLRVRVGDLVVQEQVIALMGSTGVSTGVHLHFELIIDDRHVDPLRHLP